MDARESRDWWEDPPAEGKQGEEDLSAAGGDEDHGNNPPSSEATHPVNRQQRAYRPTGAPPSFQGVDPSFVRAAGGDSSAGDSTAGDVADNRGNVAASGVLQETDEGVHSMETFGVGGMAPGGVGGPSNMAPGGVGGPSNMMYNVMSHYPPQGYQQYPAYQVNPQYQHQHHYYRPHPNMMQAPPPQPPPHMQSPYHLPPEPPSPRHYIPPNQLPARPREGGYFSMERDVYGGRDLRDSIDQLSNKLLRTDLGRNSSQHHTTSPVHQSSYQSGHIGHPNQMQQAMSPVPPGAVSPGPHYYPQGTLNLPMGQSGPYGPMMPHGVPSPIPPYCDMSPQSVHYQNSYGASMPFQSSQFHPQFHRPHLASYVNPSYNTDYGNPSASFQGSPGCYPPPPSPYMQRPSYQPPPSHQSMYQHQSHYGPPIAPRSREPTSRQMSLEPLSPTPSEEAAGYQHQPYYYSDYGRDVEEEEINEKVEEEPEESQNQTVSQRMKHKGKRKESVLSADSLENVHSSPVSPMSPTSPLSPEYHEMSSSSSAPFSPTPPTSPAQGAIPKNLESRRSFGMSKRVECDPKNVQDGEEGDGTNKSKNFNQNRELSCSNSNNDELGGVKSASQLVNSPSSSAHSSSESEDPQERSENEHDTTRDSNESQYDNVPETQSKKMMSSLLQDSLNLRDNNEEGITEFRSDSPLSSIRVGDVGFVRATLDTPQTILASTRLVRATLKPSPNPTTFFIALQSKFVMPDFSASSKITEEKVPGGEDAESSVNNESMDDDSRARIDRTNEDEIEMSMEQDSLMETFGKKGRDSSSPEEKSHWNKSDGSVSPAEYQQEAQLVMRNYIPNWDDVTLQQDDDDVDEFFLVLDANGEASRLTFPSGNTSPRSSCSESFYEENEIEDLEGHTYSLILEEEEDEEVEVEEVETVEREIDNKDINLKSTKFKPITESEEEEMDTTAEIISINQSTDSGDPQSSCISTVREPRCSTPTKPSKHTTTPVSPDIPHFSTLATAIKSSFSRNSTLLGDALAKLHPSTGDGLSNSSVLRDKSREDSDLVPVSPNALEGKSRDESVSSTDKLSISSSTSTTTSTSEKVQKASPSSAKSLLQSFLGSGKGFARSSQPRVALGNKPIVVKSKVEQPSLDTFLGNGMTTDGATRTGTKLVLPSFETNVNFVFFNTDTKHQNDFSTSGGNLITNKLVSCDRKLSPSRRDLPKKLSNVETNNNLSSFENIQLRKELSLCVPKKISKIPVIKSALTKTLSDGPSTVIEPKLSHVSSVQDSLNTSCIRSTDNLDEDNDEIETTESVLETIHPYAEAAASHNHQGPLASSVVAVIPENNDGSVIENVNLNSRSVEKTELPGTVAESLIKPQLPAGGATEYCSTELTEKRDPIHRGHPSSQAQEADGENFEVKGSISSRILSTSVGSSSSFGYQNDLPSETRKETAASQSNIPKGKRTARSSSSIPMRQFSRSLSSPPSSNPTLHIPSIKTISTSASRASLSTSSHLLSGGSVGQPLRQKQLLQPPKLGALGSSSSSGSGKVIPTSLANSFNESCTRSTCPWATPTTSHTSPAGSVVGAATAVVATKASVVTNEAGKGLEITSCQVVTSAATSVSVSTSASRTEITSTASLPEVTVVGVTSGHAISESDFVSNIKCGAIQTSPDAVAAPIKARSSIPMRSKLLHSNLRPPTSVTGLRTHSSLQRFEGAVFGRNRPKPNLSETHPTATSASAICVVDCVRKTKLGNSNDEITKHPVKKKFVGSATRVLQKGTLCQAVLYCSLPATLNVFNANDNLLGQNEKKSCSLSKLLEMHEVPDEVLTKLLLTFSRLSNNFHSGDSNGNAVRQYSLNQLQPVVSTTASNLSSNNSNLPVSAKLGHSVRVAPNSWCNSSSLSSHHQLGTILAPDCVTTRTANHQLGPILAPDCVTTRTANHQLGPILAPDCVTTRIANSTFLANPFRAYQPISPVDQATSIVRISPFTSANYTASTYVQATPSTSISSPPFSTSAIRSTPSTCTTRPKAAASCSSGAANVAAGRVSLTSERLPSARSSNVAPSCRVPSQCQNSCVPSALGHHRCPVPHGANQAVISLGYGDLAGRDGDCDVEVCDTSRGDFSQCEGSDTFIETSGSDQSHLDISDDVTTTSDDENSDDVSSDTDTRAISTVVRRNFHYSDVEISEDTLSDFSDEEIIISDSDEENSSDTREQISEPLFIPSRGFKDILYEHCPSGVSKVRSPYDGGLGNVPGSASPVQSRSPPLGTVLQRPPPSSLLLSSAAISALSAMEGLPFLKHEELDKLATLIANRLLSSTPNSLVASLTSADLATSFTSADLATSLTSGDIASSLTTSDLATSLTSADLAASLTSADIADSATRSDPSESVTSADIEASVTRSDIAASVTCADQAVSVASADGASSVTSIDGGVNSECVGISSGFSVTGSDSGVSVNSGDTSITNSNGYSLAASSGEGDDVGSDLSDTYITTHFSEPKPLVDIHQRNSDELSIPMNETSSTEELNQESLLESNNCEDTNASLVGSPCFGEAHMREAISTSSTMSDEGSASRCASADLSPKMVYSYNSRQLKQQSQSDPNLSDEVIPSSNMDKSQITAEISEKEIAFSCNESNNTSLLQTEDNPSIQVAEATAFFTKMYLFESASRNFEIDCGYTSSNTSACGTTALGGHLVNSETCDGLRELVHSNMGTGSVTTAERGPGHDRGLCLNNHNHTSSTGSDLLMIDDGLMNGQIEELHRLKTENWKKYNGSSASHGNNECTDRMMKSRALNSPDSLSLLENRAACENSGPIRTRQCFSPLSLTELAARAHKHHLLKLCNQPCDLAEISDDGNDTIIEQSNVEVGNYLTLSDECRGEIGTRGVLSREENADSGFESVTTIKPSLCSIELVTPSSKQHYLEEDQVTNNTNEGLTAGGAVPAPLRVLASLAYKQQSTGIKGNSREVGTCGGYGDVSKPLLDGSELVFRRLTDNAHNSLIEPLQEDKHQVSSSIGNAEHSLETTTTSCITPESVYSRKENAPLPEMMLASAVTRAAEALAYEKLNSEMSGTMSQGPVGPVSDATMNESVGSVGNRLESAAKSDSCYIRACLIDNNISDETNSQKLNGDLHKGSRNGFLLECYPSKIVTDSLTINNAQALGTRVDFSQSTAKKMLHDLQFDNLGQCNHGKEENDFESITSTITIAMGDIESLQWEHNNASKIPLNKTSVIDSKQRCDEVSRDVPSRPDCMEDTTTNGSTASMVTSTNDAVNDGLISALLCDGEQQNIREKTDKDLLCRPPNEESVVGGTFKDAEPFKQRTTNVSSDRRGLTLKNECCETANKLVAVSLFPNEHAEGEYFPKVPAREAEELPMILEMITKRREAANKNIKNFCFGNPKLAYDNFPKMNDYETMRQRSQSSRTPFLSIAEKAGEELDKSDESFEEINWEIDGGVIRKVSTKDDTAERKYSDSSGVSSLSDSSYRKLSSSSSPSTPVEDWNWFPGRKTSFRGDNNVFGEPGIRKVSGSSSCTSGIGSLPESHDNRRLSVGSIISNLTKIKEESALQLTASSGSECEVDQLLEKPPTPEGVLPAPPPPVWPSCTDQKPPKPPRRSTLGILYDTSVRFDELDVRNYNSLSREKKLNNKRDRRRTLHTFKNIFDEWHIREGQEVCGSLEVVPIQEEKLEAVKCMSDAGLLDSKSPDDEYFEVLKPNQDEESASITGAFDSAESMDLPGLSTSPKEQQLLEYFETNESDSVDSNESGEMFSFPITGSSPCPPSYDDDESGEMFSFPITGSSPCPPSYDDADLSAQSKFKNIKATHRKRRIKKTIASVEREATPVKSKVETFQNASLLKDARSLPNLSDVGEANVLDFDEPVVPFRKRRALNGSSAKTSQPPRFETLEHVHEYVPRSEFNINVLHENVIRLRGVQHAQSDDAILEKGYADCSASEHESDMEDINMDFFEPRNKLRVSLPRRQISKQSKRSRRFHQLKRKFSFNSVDKSKELKDSISSSLQRFKSAKQKFERLVNKSLKKEASPVPLPLKSSQLLDASLGPDFLSDDTSHPSSGTSQGQLLSSTSFTSSSTGSSKASEFWNITRSYSKVSEGSHLSRSSHEVPDFDGSESSYSWDDADSDFEYYKMGPGCTLDAHCLLYGETVSPPSAKKSPRDPRSDVALPTGPPRVGMRASGVYGRGSASEPHGDSMGSGGTAPAAVPPSSSAVLAWLEDQNSRR